MNRYWLDPVPAHPTPALLSACDNDQLVAQMLWTRGIQDPASARGFLSPHQYLPSPPEALPDLVAASEVLRSAIKSQQRILIWGDFDVDGQTATALLLEGLTRLGADVTYYLPDRAAESHGIKLSSLQRELARINPAVLLTCDTGVAEFESLNYATSVGVQVIVTDHHAISPHGLPSPPVLVINPQRLVDQNGSHPLASLPGVGVAFKLMQHLHTSFGQERKVSASLDLVALGIVGDVATQTADTRYLLQLGLTELRDTARIGLQALLEVARISTASMSAEQIGFQLAPRLNAAGRLGDANRSVELLTTRSRTDAVVIAQQLEGLNAERRLQTHQIELAALEMLANDPSLLQEPVLVLHQPHWHPGLVGIVANTLAERYQRPAILLAGDEIARGSARAPEGYDVFQLLTANAALLHTFGGHRGAAGLSLEVSKIPQLRKRLSRTLRATSDQRQPPVPVLALDLVITLDQLTLDLHAQLNRLAPFGPGNPRPVLAVLDLSLNHAANIGRQEQHRKLIVQDRAGRTQPILWWGSSSEPLPEGRFDVAFHVGISSKGELELVLVAWRQREAPVATYTPSIYVYDWRQEGDPFGKLERIAAETLNSTVIWAEGYSRQQYPQFKRRAELFPASSLIIFTPPSDAAALRAAIKTVQPTTVHLFNTKPPIYNATAVLTQLRKAADNVITVLAGTAPMDVIAGAVAASRTVVTAGLALLVARGELGNVRIVRDTVRLTRDAADYPIRSSRREQAEAQFRSALTEMTAYRRFYAKTGSDSLVNEVVHG